MFNKGHVLEYQNAAVVVCNEYRGQLSFESTTRDSVLLYVEGQGSVVANNRSYEISDTCLLALPSATKIRCSLVSENQTGRLVTVFLTQEILWDYKCHRSKLVQIATPSMIEFTKANKEYIAQFFAALVVYSKKPLAITEDILRHRIFEILYALENVICKDKVLVRETTPSHSQVQMIANHLSVDLSCRKPIPEIAKDYGVSPSTLKRWFRKGLDISVSQWMITRRLEKVRFLVRRGKSVKEASFECGFCSSSYMIKMYRKRYGCTPKQDLNQFKLNTN